MNWNIWKTTVKERAIIGDTMLGVFADLERAEVLLETVLDEHFLDREQKPIAASDADWTRSMLHTVNGIIRDCHFLSHHRRRRGTAGGSLH